MYMRVPTRGLHQSTARNSRPEPQFASKNPLPDDEVSFFCQLRCWKRRNELELDCDTVLLR